MAKVTLIVNTSWNVFNFRLPLLNALAERGFEVSVIAPEDDYTDRLGFPHQSVKMNSSSLNPLTNVRDFLDLWKKIRNSRADILLLYTVKPNIYGNIIARFLGMRTISNIAGLGTVFGRNGWLAKLVEKLYRLALGSADNVFFQNGEDLELFVNRKIVRGDRAALLPGSGVDVKRFDPRCFTSNMKHEKFIFLFAGRMLWDKGVGEYIDAAHRLLAERNDLEFRFLGFLDVDNPQAVSKAEMDAITSTYGMHYSGTSDCMDKALSEIDCLVLPTRYREGTPRILLEASAMEKAIITSDSPGCRDVVQDGATGLLCRPGDADDLYQKMSEILNMDGEKRFEMGRAARQHVVENYDEKIVIEKYLDAVKAIDSDK